MLIFLIEDQTIINSYLINEFDVLIIVPDYEQHCSRHLIQCVQYNVEALFGHLLHIFYFFVGQPYGHVWRYQVQWALQKNLSQFVIV